MRRFWNTHVVSLLQTCTSSMTAGFRLTVHKDDSFHIEDGQEIMARIAMGSGGYMDRTLVFTDNTAQIDLEGLPLDWYTLALIDQQEQPIDSEGQCFIRGCVDQACSDGNQLRFQLTDATPWKEVTMTIFGAVSELHMHVLETGAQGQQMPGGDAIYQYELTSGEHVQWVELNACNQYEALLTLPRGTYTMQPAREGARRIFDDAAMEETFTLSDTSHSLTVIEPREPWASLRIRVFVMEDDCVLTTPSDCYFPIEVSGNGLVQTLNLNEMNDFSAVLYDLSEGTYTVRAHTAENYTTLYEVDGEVQDSGVVEILENTSHSVDILYQNDASRQRRSLRVRKRIRKEGGCLMMPGEGDQFVLTISGCGSCHSFYLSKDNQFCVELADLCPGCYQIEESDAEGYVSSLQHADGERILDGCVTISEWEGADVILINEAKNSGKLQICKYEEDACGNLTAPQGDACFAVRLHSFAYQEILMLKAENDYCVALEQLPKGCYDIREIGGEQVLYSVDQGEWRTTARITIDDSRLHEIRILNLRQERTGSVRIEKWMENEHCMLLHPQCTDSFEVCVSGNGIRQLLTLSAQNQWCAYVDELPYGEYLVEELYGGDERYLVNGEPQSPARVTIQRELQEVKIINPLPRFTTLRLSVRMVNCDHQQVAPDEDFAAEVLIEGGDFCKEVTLQRSNRWQAIITGIHACGVRVLQKDTMGYHVLYQVDGQLCASAWITADGQTHDVVLVNQYRCLNGVLSVEKKVMDGGGCLHAPAPSQRYSMVLCGNGLEVPFALHAQNGFSVCFDDLPKGIYEIKEVGDTPCGWCRNGEPQEDGCVQLGSQDVHLEVIDAMAEGAALHIAYREAEGCEEQELRFAIIGADIHKVLSLHAQDSIVIDDLPSGTYEIVPAAGIPILFEINGCMYERGTVVIDRQDVYVVLVAQCVTNALTLRWMQKDAPAGRTLNTHGCAVIEVESAAGVQEVRLQEAEDHTHTLYDLPCGDVCIRDRNDPQAVVIVNNERTSDGCFCIHAGNYEAKIFASMPVRTRMAINGSCHRENGYHECVDQRMRLCLRGEGQEETFVLDAGNDWSVVLEDLPQGHYVLTALDQTICFYANAVQSYNRIELELRESLLNVQAVLEERVSQPCVRFRVRLQDAEGNEQAPADGSVFTARVIGNAFFETLVFNDANSFAQTRSVPSGRYEIFASGPANVIYDHTLINGIAHTIVLCDITADSEIVFVFTCRPSRTGVLYLQGFRRDADCDCLKPPLAETVFTLQLRSATTTQTILLTEENEWRQRIDSLENGAYTLESEGSGRRSYIVDGHASATASFQMEDDAHNIKVIDEGTDTEGALILEAWRWDGEHKEKPLSSQSLWVDVDHEKQHWELLLNEGNHWLGMIRGLSAGIYQLHVADKGNIWYQMDGQAPSQEGLAVVKDGEVHVDILLAWGEQKKGSITLEKRIRGNDGDQLPQQGTYVFVLSRPDLEERIELNAENGYRQRVEFLEPGRYVLDEQGEGTVTYRIDGGSERTHACIEVAGDHHEVIAINHEQSTSLSSLEVIGEQLSAPTTFRLQKAGVDLVIELSPANGYHQVLEDIAPGRYSLSAVEGCYLYQLDGRSRRHHCTIVFAQDAHTVVITPCTDPLDIPAFASREKDADGVIRLRLWERDARGERHVPLGMEPVVITLGEDLQVSLGEDTGYQAEAHALAYGRYPLTASRPCLFQIDGGSEQRHASVELQSSAMRQIDVIVERFDDRPQQTTKLIL